jgi:predicted RNA-binding protein YlqC (UPF0109 family)
VTVVKDLVLVLTKALVDDPQSVTVEEVKSPDGELIYEVRVAQDDMGKVIGKQGRIVKAIRTVVKASAVRQGKRVSVEIVQ